MTSITRGVPCADAGSTLPTSAVPWQNQVNAEIVALWNRAPQELTVASGTNDLVCTIAVQPPALVAGMLFGLTPPAANTGAMTLQIGSLSPAALRDATGAALVGGDVVAGRRLLVAYDGTLFRILGYTVLPYGRRGGLTPVVQQCMLAANRTGLNDTSNQPIFDAANDTVTLEGSATYEFELLLLSDRAAGTTSHTTALRFGGTAVGTQRGVVNVANPTGDVIGNVSAKRLGGSLGDTTVVTAANTAATENLIITARGVIRTSAAGTLVPQFVYSAAPGGAPTLISGSFFRIWPVGSDTVTAVGNYWS